MEILRFFQNLFRRNRADIKIGINTKISKKSKIETLFGGKITIGNNCQIEDFSMLLTYGGNIEIGDECSVNPFCVLYGHGGLKVGNKVRIATHTVIIPANHVFDNITIPIMNQPETRKGIVIGNDVWIGNGARILDGVVLGSGVVVGAGSVVTQSFPDNVVIAGVPAKIIKHRK
ncbi:MAG: acyltransferase [Sphingobacteriales bacterium]|jgi:acetyltransferase-like isoleucine patch superfamily enzyme|nr:MAG: acyltransferase [Sphingobacteriales bacterium]